jgi:alanine racemase
VVRVRGIFSHLANAGADADRAQATRFDEAVALLRAAGCDPDMVHLAASAATLASPHLHYNTVRVGMAIFGLSPFADKTSADLGLIPAMTLRSEIVALRDVSAGTGVSYGFNHIAQSDTTLALVPMGYADGLPRALNGAGATVAVAGQHCPIVGRIGMDQCIVDLGKLGKRVQIGDPVVLFGDPASGLPPVEVWAEVMQTINYEIVVGIGSRVNRIAADEDRNEQGDVSGASTTLTISDPDEMHELGVRVGEQLVAGDLVILTGPLGAGKTTLSRGIGEGLRVRGPVTSPTFVLARTHPSLVDGPPLVHLDAYRLGDAAELDDLDLDFAGSVVLAEWGAGLVEPGDSHLEIVIERPTGAIDRGDDAGQRADDQNVARDEDMDELIEPRTVTIAGYGARWMGGVI